MNGTSLVGFLCIVGIGSYLQAFSGFALGIFVLGAVVMLQLVSLETTAIAINIMMVVNTAVALRGNIHLMDRKLFARTLVGIIPGVPVGLWLLDTLSARSTQLLQFTLGLVVLLTGALLFAKPKPRSTASGSGSFAVAGALGGVLAGLFSVPGPPVIYHFYVQPMPLEQVRLTLLGIFGTVSLLRLMFLLADGSIGPDALYLGALSIPVVAAATALFMRYPPALSEIAVRRSVFVLLSAMGVGILAMAWV
jgi:uncharacterized membrane protein YfcA